MSTHRAPLPLVYSCSGCSGAAQMANHLALELDRRGAAEMSCIAGVGGDVPALVRLAKSGRRVIALDGCPLHCVASCLARHAVIPEMHYTLSDFGVKKRPGAGFDPGKTEGILQHILERSGGTKRVQHAPQRNAENAETQSTQSTQSV